MAPAGFLIKLSVFVGMPNRATPGIKPGEPRNSTGWQGPGTERQGDNETTVLGAVREPGPERQGDNETTGPASCGGGGQRQPVVSLSQLSQQGFSLSLGRVFPVSVLGQLQALFREMPKNLVFRRPADFRASRCQDVQSLGLQSACKPGVCWLRSYSGSL